MFQTSILFFFCIQNSDFSTRIASLYWSQPSSVVFACKTATLWPQLIVSMGTRPHLSFWATWLASEILVYMGPSPHLWFLQAKRRLLDQNYKSLWVPDLSYVFFCMQNNVISIRITSLYGSQLSSVVFVCKTATFGSELQVSMGPTLRLLICECKTAYLHPEWRLSICPHLHLWFCAFKTAPLARKY